MSTYGNFYIFDSGLAKKFGKKEAIFIAYILAWQKISKTGWVFRTQKEISENTTLSRFQQESARRKLKLIGVLSELRTGQPSRLYYKIDESQLEKYFSEKLEEKKAAGAENQNERNSQSRVRETSNLEKSPTDNNIKPQEDEKSSVTNNITNNIDENSNFHLDPSPKKKSSSLISFDEKSKNIEEKADVINHLKSKKKNQIYEIFLIYSKHYFSRYKSYPAFTPKLAGQIKYLFSSIRDIEKIERMIEAFINDESSFLCMRFHDFGLMISNMNKYLVLFESIYPLK